MEKKQATCVNNVEDFPYILPTLVQISTCTV